ncbi:MAG: Gfo/Idh/MocA family oxidoreductase [Clostridia bacterium]
MIRIGVIGCGGIGVGKHMEEYRNVAEAKVVALCDIDEKRLAEIGEKYGIAPAFRFTDYRALLALPEIDAVDICTPNDSHVEIALEAVRRGKPFQVEKPVGTSYAQTRMLLDAANAAGIPTMVSFSYRFKPAVRYAKALIDAGKIGRVHSIYANYLKESALWEGRRLDWRFEKAIAQYGVSGDLGVHILDMIALLAGAYTGVFAQTGIVVKERKRLHSEEIAPVDTDDYCHFLAELAGGASAMMGVTRAAMGNINHIRVEMYGERGGFRFDLNDDRHIEIMDACGQSRCEDVPPQYVVGQQQSFIDMLLGREVPLLPTLEDGVCMQRVLDGILASAAERRWVAIGE